jgi:hypothetical protein
MRGGLGDGGDVLLSFLSIARSGVIQVSIVYSFMLYKLQGEVDKSTLNTTP